MIAERVAVPEQVGFSTSRLQRVERVVQSFVDRGVISGAVDPNTRTLRVRVVLANPDSLLKPSMFGSVRILRSSSQGIVVPSTAVIREGTDSYVFAVKAPNHYVRRAVTLGRAFDSSLEIVNGLAPGDNVVSDGALLLRAATRD